MVLVFLCLYMSLCRGAIIGIGYEILGFIFLYYYMRNVESIQSKQLIIFLMIVIVLPLNVVAIASRSYDYERVLLWISGFHIFTDHIFFGVGLTNFNYFYNEFYISPLANEPYLRHPHNVLLLILAETGLFGFLLFVNVIYYIIKLSLNHIKKFDLKHSRASIVCIFLLALLGVSVHSQVDCTPLWRPIRTAMIFIWTMTCVYMCEVKRIE